ncbi:MAG: ATP-dependent RNA helicase RhlB [Oceanicoccus sp.]|uniref:ATP-dependent RNA helicase RhlB n=1 Tax=Oceanicoccus sp. TaxID=2691044 RepID=UPI00260B3E8F|nr:ATP-dependent RNA helicase RhlB [Oceanicoccus sp.]MDG1773145.1 ATP-dependent RNA helicase RhlB [Oceanicoccus sp.]
MIGKLFGKKKTPATHGDSASTERKSGGKSPASNKSGKSAKPGHQKSGNQQKTARSNHRKRKAKPAAPQWTIDQFPVPEMEGKTRFHDLDLDDRLMHGIADLGFEYCSPIQAGVLPQTLQGQDAIGKAQTGTGKTAAFLVTIIQDLLSNPITDERYAGEPRALVIAPTRELVVQIGDDAKNLTKHAGLNVATLIGGMDYNKQLNQLKGELVDIVVATPGRLLDFQSRRDLFLDQVEILVIDEADRMLDMGFIPQVRRIVRSTPNKDHRQTLLFSATFTPEVLSLTEQWTYQPFSLEIEPESVATDTVDQKVYIVAADEKLALLKNIIKLPEAKSVIVFANRRDQTRKLYEGLRKDGVKCGILSGEIPQNKRSQTLARFKEGGIQVLVATDVAGRGIHVDGISHVVNYTLPEDPEDYVHRIGRTGRAGATGTSISFACEDDAFLLAPLEEMLGNKLPCEQPPVELLS